MPQKIRLDHYILNLIAAAIITAILAVPIAWWLSDAVLLISKSIRYQHTEFAPFELVFISEEMPENSLNGDFDFVLHPDLFRRDGTTYSNKINGRQINFTTESESGSETDCKATVDSQSVGCLEIFYGGGDPSEQHFVHLYGEIGIPAEQSSELNAQYFQFDKLLETIRNIFLVLIPVLMFLCIWAVGRNLIKRRLPQTTISMIQGLGLLIPWAIGLAFWTTVRIGLENLFG